MRSIRIPLTPFTRGDYGEVDCAVLGSFEGLIPFVICRKSTFAAT